jgi:hypothetical protein
MSTLQLMGRASHGATSAVTLRRRAMRALRNNEMFTTFWYLLSEGMKALQRNWGSQSRAHRAPVLSHVVSDGQRNGIGLKPARGFQQREAETIVVLLAVRYPLSRRLRIARPPANESAMGQCAA